MHIFVSEAHDTTQQRNAAIPALTSDKANGLVHSPWRVQRHLRHAFFRQLLQPTTPFKLAAGAALLLQRD